MYAKFQAGISAPNGDLPVRKFSRVRGAEVRANGREREGVCVCVSHLTGVPPHTLSLLSPEIFQSIHSTRSLNESCLILSYIYSNIQQYTPPQTCVDNLKG